MARSRPANQPGFFDFLGWRRRLLSDRAWFGCAFLLLGLASLAYSGWGLLFATLGVIAGLALLAWAMVLAVGRQRRDGGRSDGQPWF